MAVRKKGLGKGLDSMFPVYDDIKAVQTADTVSESSEEQQKNSNLTSREKKTTVRKKNTSSGSSRKITTETVVKNDTADQSEAESGKGVLTVKISEVEPNKGQPRKEFDRDGLEELSGSIKQYGVIQPLIVKKCDDYYEIIAGERRWRAAKMAGLKEVPVIVKEYNDREIMEVSLIENIQREDLNPIEEAEAYQRLIEEYEMRQEELAEKVSKSRTTITNALRLLKLDERVRELVTNGQLTTGHARALLSLTDKDQQFHAAEMIVEKKLSVREVEKLVKKLSEPLEEPQQKKKESQALELIYKDLENQMKTVLGTKVSVHQKDAQKGKIEIAYYSTEDLERIFDLIRSIGSS